MDARKTMLMTVDHGLDPVSLRCRRVQPAVPKYCMALCQDPVGVSCPAVSKTARQPPTHTHRALLLLLVLLATTGCCCHCRLLLVHDAPAVCCWLVIAFLPVAACSLLFFSLSGIACCYLPLSGCYWPPPC